MPRNATDRLRNAEANGAYITTNSGEPVTYDYDHKHRDKPWKTADGRRFAGTECKANVP